MRILSTLTILALALGGCSETTIEDQDESVITETERQIEEEAKSLEEAANEAVQALEEEIENELADDGIVAPEEGTAASDSDEEG